MSLLLSPIPGRWEVVMPVGGNCQRGLCDAGRSDVFIFLQAAFRTGQLLTMFSDGQDAHTGGAGQEEQNPAGSLSRQGGQQLLPIGWACTTSHPQRRGFRGIGRPGVAGLPGTIACSCGSLSGCHRDLVWTGTGWREARGGCHWPSSSSPLSRLSVSCLSSTLHATVRY